MKIFWSPRKDLNQSHSPWGGITPGTQSNHTPHNKGRQRLTISNRWRTRAIISGRRTPSTWQSGKQANLECTMRLSPNWVGYIQGSYEIRGISTEIAVLVKVVSHENRIFCSSASFASNQYETQHQTPLSSRGNGVFCLKETGL